MCRWDRVALVCSAERPKTLQSVRVVEARPGSARPALLRVCMLCANAVPARAVVCGRGVLLAGFLRVAADAGWRLKQQHISHTHTHTHVRSYPSDGIHTLSLAELCAEAAAVALRPLRPQLDPAAIARAAAAAARAPQPAAPAADDREGKGEASALCARLSVGLSGHGCFVLLV